MNLLLDLGNTRLKWAVAECGRLRSSGSTGYDSDFLAELAAALPDSGRVEQVVAVSVSAAEHWQRVLAWANEHGLPAPSQRHTAARFGRLVCAYSDPRRMGADRWMALIAAYLAGCLPVVVVDAGSALTLDAVAADCRHLGGRILPGLAAMRGAFPPHAPGLTAPGEGAVQRFAKDTATAMHSGVLLGVAAIVEGFYRDAVAATDGREPHLLLTGGDAELLLPVLRIPALVRSELVLEGLAAVAEAE